MSLTRDVVLDFMTFQDGPVCGTCVATALGLKFDDVTAALSDIRVRRDLPVQTAACSKCHRRAYVVFPPQSRAG